MAVLEEFARVAPARETCVTVGVFDGVHLGHQHLLSCLAGCARRRGALSCVVTFSNHPRSVLKPNGPTYITSLGRRIELIKALGIDLVVAVPFTRELSLLSARDFVLRLRNDLKMRGLVVGPDFVLGHNREGDVARLSALGEELGFEVSVINQVYTGEALVKSTAVREALAAGDVAAAGRMLGRPFSLDGTVVRGDGRGRVLGFPTANVQVDPERIVPANGIYATWTIVDGARHRAATSIGVRPTFGASGRTIEAFLMDFSGDLYGKRLKLEFVARLRDELKFPSVQALIEQMHRDVALARELLK